MPESANTKSPVASITVGLLVLLLAGGGLFVGMQAMSGSRLEPFPASDYLESPTDYLGNTYALRAQIDAQLKWQKGLGRIVAVLPEGANRRLPVYIPESAGSNIHKGQRYEMEIRIEEGGLIYVENLRKY